MSIEFKEGYEKEAYHILKALEEGKISGAYFEHVENVDFDPNTVRTGKLLKHMYKLVYNLISHKNSK